MDWKKNAALMRPLKEGRLGKLVPIKDIEVGDDLVVTSKLGRSVASGKVMSKDEGRVITLRLITNGVVQTQSFAPEIYSFYKLDQEESANLAEGNPVVDIGSTVANNPYDSPNTGALPAAPDAMGGNPYPNRQIEILCRDFGFGLHHANQMWCDIQSFGFYRAMSRHHIPEPVQESILAALRSEDLVHAGAPEPEWIEISKGVAFSIENPPTVTATVAQG